MKLLLAASCSILSIFCGTFAAEDDVCPKNYTFPESTGDAVLSVFVDSEDRSECNTTASSKSIHEAAIAFFVTQTLNEIDYVPGVKIGLRVRDTCNDRLLVYRQGLTSAAEVACSDHYELGILAPERFMEVLEPFKSLGILPVYAYGSPELNIQVIEALVEFISARYETVDLVLSSSPVILRRFLRVSKGAGVCVKSATDLERKDNDTEHVIVALGDYEDLSTWIDEQRGKGPGDEDFMRIWIALPVDYSNVDGLLPSGSYVLKPEELPLDPSQDLESLDILQVPANTISRSPYMLSIGKAIVEIARAFEDMRSENCPRGIQGCVLPPLNSRGLRSISNLRLYEMLHIQAKSYSTRYVMSQKREDEMLDVAGYTIDVARAYNNSVLVDKPESKLPELCIKSLADKCTECLNFQEEAAAEEEEEEEDEDEEEEEEEDDEGDEGEAAEEEEEEEDEDEEEEEEEEEDDDEGEAAEEEEEEEAAAAAAAEEGEEGEGKGNDEGKEVDEPSTEDLGILGLKAQLWVPIFLLIINSATLVCFLILGFVLYLFFMAKALEGHPGPTILLVLASVFMLQSVVPFCLRESRPGAQQLNAGKIFVSSLSFGLAFSVMLTRALFLAFTSNGVFSQHINGYLQSFMLLFMATVELAISTMYYLLGDVDSGKVMRSPTYVALLSYDIFLLLLLFGVCCFIPHVQRNYNEGVYFLGTSMGLVVCWITWLACFFIMPAEERDLIVAFALLGTACLIVIGILVPRAYFMYLHLHMEKNLVGRFESMDFAPDPRMNNTARQALDLQSRQSEYEYVNCCDSDTSQQEHHQVAAINYYGSTTSPKNKRALRHRILDPRHAPGYNNYGFRSEIRELDAAYVIPRLNVDDSDVCEVQQSMMTISQRRENPLEGRYTHSRSSLVGKGRAGGERTPANNCIETEVYVEDRLHPHPQGPNEHYPRRPNSPRLSPTHATIREEEECEHTMRITRF